MYANILQLQMHITCQTDTLHLLPPLFSAIILCPSEAEPFSSTVGDAKIIGLYYLLSYYRFICLFS